MRNEQVSIRPIDGPGHLLLRQTGNLVELIAGNVVLLSSAALETEFAFGRLAGAFSPRRPLKRVIVGGLGFGATLRGVLEVTAPDTNVIVVEKVEAVVGLVRGPLAHIAQSPLSDPRVELVEGDVRHVVAQHVGDVGVILLDVDNGPHWASFRTNAGLYTRAGLSTLKRALVAGGTLAVWSGYRADPFLGQLRGAGLRPSVVPLAEKGRVRARAYVGLA